MKKFILLAVILGMGANTFAGGDGPGNSGGSDHAALRTSPEFLKTCPEKYLTYYDKNEGGPGAYCSCPDENITYIDKAEGGTGFICLEIPGT